MFLETCLVSIYETLSLLQIICSSFVFNKLQINGDLNGLTTP